MAKRARREEIGANGIDGDKVAAYVRKIEDHFETMASEQGAYMARCKGIRGSIQVVYEEAKALGIPAKVLRAHVELRKLEAKKEALVEKLEGDDADSFERVSAALGDFAALPLGMAALQGKKQSSRSAQVQADSSTLDELVH